MKSDYTRLTLRLDPIGRMPALYSNRATAVFALEAFGVRSRTDDPALRLSPEEALDIAGGRMLAANIIFTDQLLRFYLLPQGALGRAKPITFLIVGGIYPALEGRIAPSWTVEIEKRTTGWCEPRYYLGEDYENRFPKWGYDLTGELQADFSLKPKAGEITAGLLMERGITSPCLIWIAPDYSLKWCPAIDRDALVAAAKVGKGAPIIRHLSLPSPVAPGEQFRVTCPKTGSGLLERDSPPYRLSLQGQLLEQLSSETNPPALRRLASFESWNGRRWFNPCLTTETSPPRPRYVSLDVRADPGDNAIWSDYRITSERRQRFKTLKFPWSIDAPLLLVLAAYDCESEVLQLLEHDPDSPHWKQCEAEILGWSDSQPIGLKEAVQVWIGDVRDLTVGSALSAVRTLRMELLPRNGTLMHHEVLMCVQDLSFTDRVALHQILNARPEGWSKAVRSWQEHPDGESSLVAVFRVELWCMQMRRCSDFGASREAIKHRLALNLEEALPAMMRLRDQEFLQFFDWLLCVKNVSAAPYGGASAVRSLIKLLHLNHDSELIEDTVQTLKEKATERWEEMPYRLTVEALSKLEPAVFARLWQSLYTVRSLPRISVVIGKKPFKSVEEIDPVRKVAHLAARLSGRLRSAAYSSIIAGLEQLAGEERFAAEIERQQAEREAHASKSAPQPEMEIAQFEGLDESESSPDSSACREPYSRSEPQVDSAREEREKWEARRRAEHDAEMQREWERKQREIMNWP